MNSAIKMNCATARSIDIIEYLASLGCQPQKIKGNEYWYLSPLRNEKTASFKVNRRLNRWIDLGDGSRGNVIDLGTAYHRCTVAEFLEKIERNVVLPPAIHTIGNDPAKRPAISILKTKVISSLSLCKYIRERRVSIQVAQRFCEEITYEVKGKQYKAIGFKNEAGGYELRSAAFKGSNAPKTYTHISNGSKKLHVFEGFFDMLTWQTIAQSPAQKPTDILVLNSLSFFEKARPLMERYQSIDLFLDNNNAGEKCTGAALKISGKYCDKRSLYKGYEDLNEWCRHVGKRQQHPKLT